MSTERVVNSDPRILRIHRRIDEDDYDIIYYNNGSYPVVKMGDIWNVLWEENGNSVWAPASTKDQEKFDELLDLHSTPTTNDQPVFVYDTDLKLEELIIQDIQQAEIQFGKEIPS